jgi:hypothetical protein
MSLNDIQLSSFQLAELYGRNLVMPAAGEEPGTVTRPPAPPQHKQEDVPAVQPAERTNPNVEPRLPTPGSLQYLGKHQKKIAILVSNPKEVYLPESELSFLTAILQACRLNLGDVAIVNHARHPLSPAELRQQLESEYILVFGVPVADPALAHQPSFVPLSQDGHSIVLVPALSQLNNTSAEAKTLKSKLWICLKQLFGV